MKKAILILATVILISCNKDDISTPYTEVVDSSLSDTVQIERFIKGR